MTEPTAPMPDPRGIHPADRTELDQAWVEYLDEREGLEAAHAAMRALCDREDRGEPIGVSEWEDAQDAISAWRDGYESASEWLVEAQRQAMTSRPL